MTEKVKKRSTLPFGAWSEQTTFIIGGGPSLKDQMKFLPILQKIGGRIIVTNNAYKLIPDADILHFADDVWYGWHKETIPLIFRGTYITTAAQGSPASEWNRRGIHYFRKHSNNGITNSTAMLCGSNSGHQAMNLAIHMGSKKLVLLGFDMNPTAPETNWHNEHKRPTARNSYKDVMIPGMQKTAPILEKMGVSAINTSLKSNIDCFRKRSLEEVITEENNNNNNDKEE